MVDEKLIKLAVDSYYGRTGSEYSVSDSMEVLRNALAEANNGSSKLNFKDLRDGKCNGLFSVVEVLVEKINEEGLKGDEFFVNFIEDRNVALGDTPVFHIEKDCLFAVADIAEGTQGVRRQRLEASTDVTKDLPTPPFPDTTPIIFLMDERGLGSIRKLSGEFLSLQFAEHPSQL